MRILAALISLALVIQEPATLTVDVRLQQIVVTVRDSSGKIVRGLGKDDFIIEDNGAPQKITLFSDNPDAPISLAILIDTSGSMGRMPGGTVSGVAAAAGITRVLLHRLMPDDEIMLMTFSNSIRSQSISVRQGFTKDHLRIEDALAGLQADGETSVLSALTPALEQLKKAKYSKRALIVMTDAYFSGDVQQLAGEIRRAEVPIFAFAMRGIDFGPNIRSCSSACHQFELLPAAGFTGGGLPNRTQAFLDTLAEESGGRSTIFEMDPRDTMLRINAAIDDIAAELRGQYLLGYNLPTADTNRSIRVRMLIPSYRVHMRRESQVLGGRSPGN